MVFAIEALALLMFIKESFFDSGSVNSLERPEAGRMDDFADLWVNTPYGRENIRVDIKAKDRTREECEALLEAAKDEVLNTVLGENEKADAIDSDLDIRDSYVKGTVKARWEFDPPEFIDASGAIIRESLTKKTIVNVNCFFNVGDVEEIYSFPIALLTPDTSTSSGFGFLLRKAILDEEQKTNSPILSLPEKIGKEEITWEKKKSRDWILMAVFGAVAGLGIILGAKEDEKKKEKERQKYLEEDYPEIVSSLSLYVSAGITVKSALGRIAEGYKRRPSKEIDRPGFEAILWLLRRMQDGGGEIESIGAFGKMVGHKNYRKLSLLLTQNLRKGGSALSDSLEKEEHNAFEERKLRAKIAGEEASTKLLIPMMGLLGIVVVVLVFPAFLGMSM